MVINFNDELYPESLKNIQDSPNKIYVIGNVELLKKPGIAIVGTRCCTKYGAKMARKFSKDLCKKGLAVISGMALGIDSYAHIGALNSGGKTIAVLPSGLENVYPKENKELFKRIIESGGLVVTEYSSTKEANSKTFLERNRIVSGLAMATLVVEGSYRSGTSVTARITRENDKSVFCVPGALDNSKSYMPNKLIKEGAILVTDVYDIINYFPKFELEEIDENNELKEIDINNENKTSKNNIANEEEMIIDERYQDIYSVLQIDKPMHINEIVKRLKIGIDEVSYKLFIMELDEKVITLPGKNFLRR